MLNSIQSRVDGEHCDREIIDQNRLFQRRQKASFTQTGTGDGEYQRLEKLEHRDVNFRPEC